MKKLIWILVVASVGLAATASRSIWDGVFSPEQVARGKIGYANECADCHGEELEGDGKKSPALKGPVFFKNWRNKSISRLIETTRRTMPPEEPAILSRQLCTDITAYILAENGYPAGKADVAADAPELRQIVLEPKR
jgi:cytochrome c553